MALGVSAWFVGIKCHLGIVCALMAGCARPIGVRLEMRSSECGIEVSEFFEIVVILGALAAQA